MELYYQQLVDFWLKIIWSLVALLSLAIAYARENQSIAWAGCLGMTVLSCLVVVPEWPIWKGHPIIFRGIVTEKNTKRE